MKTEEFKKKYKNQQVYLIEIQSKKLIQCLKIYSDKLRNMSLKGDDEELEAIKLSLGNSLKKLLLFITTRLILARFFNFKYNLFSKS
jgi:hypothetical protein